MLQTVELKVEMVGIHEKRLRKCLSKLKGTVSFPTKFIKFVWFFMMGTDGGIYRNREGGSGCQFPEGGGDRVCT